MLIRAFFIPGPISVDASFYQNFIYRLESRPVSYHRNFESTDTCLMYVIQSPPWDSHCGQIKVAAPGTDTSNLPENPPVQARKTDDQTFFYLRRGLFSMPLLRLPPFPPLVTKKRLRETRANPPQVPQLTVSSSQRTPPAKLNTGIRKLTLNVVVGPAFRIKRK